jgi:hypothetical protein
MIACRFPPEGFWSCSSAAKETESSGEEGWGSSGEGATEDRREGRQGKRSYIAHLDSLKRREFGRFKWYPTMARDLARRAERASLTLSDLDPRAAIKGHYQALPEVGRRTLSTVVMKVLHHQQMKLDDYRRPDHQPAVQSTSREARLQPGSKV